MSLIKSLAVMGLTIRSCVKLLPKYPAETIGVKIYVAGKSNGSVSRASGAFCLLPSAFRHVLTEFQLSLQ